MWSLIMWKANLSNMLVKLILVCVSHNLVMHMRIAHEFVITHIFFQLHIKLGEVI
jgi:hypothetical protein